MKELLEKRRCPPKRSETCSTVRQMESDGKASQRDAGGDTEPHEGRPSAVKLTSHLGQRTSRSISQRRRRVSESDKLRSHSYAVQLRKRGAECAEDLHSSSAGESEDEKGGRETSIGAKEKALELVSMIPVDERENLGPIAIANYAKFHVLNPDDVSLSDVVLSSAGLQGWAEADIQEVVLTLSIVEFMEGAVVVSCTDMSGKTVATLPVSPDQPLDGFRVAVAEHMHKHWWQLRLVCSDARMLDSGDPSQPLLDLILNETRGSQQH